MRLLRVFRFGFVNAVRFRQIFITKFIANGRAAITNRLANHRNTIGTHISNEARCFAANIHAFIEHLRGAHGLRGREAELTGGFLLHG